MTPCIRSTALEVVLIAQDLIAWTQGLCLTGKLAKAEPKALRTGMLTKGQVDPRISAPVRVDAVRTASNALTKRLNLSAFSSVSMKRTMEKGATPRSQDPKRRPQCTTFRSASPPLAPSW